MNEARLADLLDAYARRHGVPGAALGVLRDGKVTAVGAGVADVTTGEPVTARTPFSAGSLTKSMVATVVAWLADAGRLSLDDPVAVVLPELRDRAWANRATVRDLLANRSRLPLSNATEFGFDHRTDAGDGALAGLVRDLPGGPGTGRFWSYSNAGWCVLGRVIENVTGQAWAIAMRQWLAEPAGMSHTAFDGQSSRARGHDVTSAGPVPVSPLTSRAYAPAGTTTATTVGDLLRFAALHLSDDRLEPLRSTHAEVRIDGWLDAWCLGWARFDWPDGSVWGWDGLVNGERSILRFQPATGTAIALMTNSSNGRALYRSLFPELIACDFARPASPPPEDFARYAGVYAWPDSRIEVSATATGLLIREDGRDQTAVPLDARTFLVDAADPDCPTVTFGDFDQYGRPQILYQMLWGLPRIETIVNAPWLRK